MSRQRSIGRCNICQLFVFGGDGTPNNPGDVQQGAWRRPHRHKQPYRVRPDQPKEPDDGEIRDWEIVSGAWRWI